MDLRALMTKLQRALCMRGRVVRLYTMQTYIEDTKRLATKYKLIETVEGENGKRHNDILIETYRANEVVKCLAAMMDGDAVGTE